MARDTREKSASVAILWRRWVVTDSLEAAPQPPMDLRRRRAGHAKVRTSESVKPKVT